MVVVFFEDALWKANWTAMSVFSLGLRVDGANEKKKTPRATCGLVIYS